MNNKITSSEDLKDALSQDIVPAFNLFKEPKPDETLDPWGPSELDFLFLHFDKFWNIKKDDKYFNEKVDTFFKKSIKKGITKATILFNYPKFGDIYYDKADLVRFKKIAKELFNKKAKEYNFKLLIIEL